MGKSDSQAARAPTPPRRGRTSLRSANIPVAEAAGDGGKGILDPFPALSLLRARGLSLVPVTRSSDAARPGDIIISTRGSFPR